MRHAVVIFQDGRILVVVEIRSSNAYMMQEEIDAILDKYAEQYAITREGLTGFYRPLITVS